MYGLVTLAREQERDVCVGDGSVVIVCAYRARQAMTGLDDGSIGDDRMRATGLRVWNTSRAKNDFDRWNGGVRPEVNGEFLFCKPWSVNFNFVSILRHVAELE